jgi:hypothetical protein
VPIKRITKAEAEAITTARNAKIKDDQAKVKQKLIDRERQRIPNRQGDYVPDEAAEIARGEKIIADRQRSARRASLVRRTARTAERLRNRPEYRPDDSEEGAARAAP